MLIDWCLFIYSFIWMANGEYLVELVRNSIGIFFEGDAEVDLMKHAIFSMKNESH